MSLLRVPEPNLVGGWNTVHHCSGDILFCSVIEQNDFGSLPGSATQSKVICIMSNILDSFRLDNKIALVTGSAGGMGQAIAVALAEAGATIATHDIKAPTNTVELVEAAGSKAAAFSADLSDTAAPDALFKEVLAKFGRVDILVNNAGIILREDAVNVPLADWLKVIQINENAVFQLSQLAGRDMMARKAPGKIINIASLLSFQGGIRVPSYAAAKGAVAQITKALANEWAVKEIQVNAIAPGYIATNNTAQLRADPERSKAILDRIPAGRWGEATDVAGTAVFLASAAANYITGHVLVVDGGWMAR
jgi:2-dehydro-3-deoxy-D-gluconate 5-dehydrogenase